MLLFASHLYSFPIQKDCLRAPSSFQDQVKTKRIVDANKATLVSSPIKVLIDQSELRHFIEEYLSKRYKYWGLPEDLASRIIQTLVDNVDDVEKARREVYAKVIDFDKDEQWSAAYKRYKDATKYISAYSQVEKFIKDLPPKSRILDIGAGNNAFGATMAENLPVVDVVGVDVMDYHEERNIQNLSYLRQYSPTKLPEEIVDDSVDVITINAVFHHVSSEFVDDLMKEIVRVLKPGGTVILIEDTYSLKLPIDDTSDQELTENFLELVKKHGPQFARNFFTFNDW